MILPHDRFLQNYLRRLDAAEDVFRGLVPFATEEQRRRIDFHLEKIEEHRTLIRRVQDLEGRALDFLLRAAQRPEGRPLN